MRTPYKIVLAAAVVVATGLLTTIGHAQDPRWQTLRDDGRIANGLLLTMVTTFLVEGCDGIDVRRARSTPFLIGLARHGMSLGYSRAEIEAFIDDPVERARVEAQADAYLAQNGASRSNPASLCQMGRDEIAAGSAIGRMLRDG